MEQFYKERNRLKKNGARILIEVVGMNIMVISTYGMDVCMYVCIYVCIFLFNYAPAMHH